jgi:hypothetical protein
MIIEMTASALLSWHVSSSYATSREAHQIASQIREGFVHLCNSRSLCTEKAAALNELFSVAEECKNANWDGYGAAPVANETYLIAYRFVDALAPSIPRFTVGAESDGHLTLEWHSSVRRTLSVSVSPEGDLHYAALLGRRKQYGTEPFLGDVPKVISALIAEVTATTDENAHS